MARSERGTVHGRSGEPEPGDVALLPVTDWKTCQGADCTARTLCHYTCLGDCAVVVNPVNGAIGGCRTSLPGTIQPARAAPRGLRASPFDSSVGREAELQVAGYKTELTVKP
jgi:hypothetical protein